MNLPLIRSNALCVLLTKRPTRLKPKPCLCPLHEIRCNRPWLSGTPITTACMSSMTRGGSAIRGARQSVRRRGLLWNPLRQFRSVRITDVLPEALVDVKKAFFFQRHWHGRSKHCAVNYEYVIAHRKLTPTVTTRPWRVLVLFVLFHEAEKLTLFKYLQLD